MAGLCCLALLAAGSVDAKSRRVSVRHGKSIYTRIFPANRFSVRDHRQLTGRRVHLKRGRDYPNVGGRVRKRCTSRTYSICDGIAQINKLDGFDLQPRVTVPFSGSIRLSSVNDRDFFIADRHGRFASGLRQLTFDPVTHTLAGISDQFLRERTRYEVHVTSDIRDRVGRRVKACRAACVSRFTTRSAETLPRIRRSLDLPFSNARSAYRLAGFPGPASRRLSFVQNGKADVFLASSVAPSIADPVNGIVRTDQVKVNPKAAAAFEASAVPNLNPQPSAGYYAFGSFLSPRYQYVSSTHHVDHRYGKGSGRTDGEIPPVPTRRTAKPLGADRIGAAVVTPNPVTFPPPWPAAVYGPGFTRSHYDLFVTADYNAARGILTIATDPAGHAYGPQSTTSVTAAGQKTTFRSYGRGRDLDGDGKIGDGLYDGVSPTGHYPKHGKELPSHKPIDGLQSGLIQTVVDNMALGRALRAGVDIPGIGKDVVDRSRIMYYGLSFGGIYGTMLMGTDPLFHRGLLNVPGGPIVDIARLSSFRGDLADQLARSRPSMLNGGPGLHGFTEDLPLRGEKPRVIKHRGAAALQELFGTSNWYERAGSPETLAPRIRLRPDPAWRKHPKEIAFQTAYGDGTVPNFTAGTLYRAGHLFDRVVYYRNDKTPTYDSDPHGWLADPTLAGRTAGEQQLAEFLDTGQLINTDPEMLEVPIANPHNLDCLHYPNPETGQEQVRQPYPASGDC
jgi:hypothetical protein